MPTNSIRTHLLCATAALALWGCGGAKDSAQSSEAAKPEAVSKSVSGSPLDKPFKLSNAEEVDVETIVSSVGFFENVEYESAAFDSDLGATVFTNITPKGGMPAKIGRIEVYGLDTDVINTFKSGEPMDAPQEMFKKLRFFDVEADFTGQGAIPAGASQFAADGPKGKLKIGALEIDAFSFQQLAEDDSAEMTDEQEAASFAQKAQSIILGGLAMKEFSYSLPAEQAEGTAMDIKADDVRIGDYKAGKFGGIYLANVDFDITRTDESVDQQLAALGPQAGMLANSPLRNMIFPSGQQGSIGELKFDGFSFANLLPYLEKGEKPPVDAKNLISVGAMEILDQSSSINGKQLSTVAKTTIAPISFVHFMPKQIKIVSEGAVSDFTALVDDSQADIQSVLTNNGLDNVSSSSKFLFNYDPKAKTIEIDSTGKADGVYGMDLKFNMGNFDYATFASEADEDTKSAAIEAMSIDNMLIRVDDDKLLDTIFSIVGLSNGQEPATVRQQAVGLLTLGALQGAQINPRISDYATALSTFIGEGGTLEIKASPEAPVSLVSLKETSESNPGAILDSLNLTVEQKN